MTEDETIVEQPFDWNESMAEVAIEDVICLKMYMSYCRYQNIMMALTKLKILEDQGKKVECLPGKSYEWRCDYDTK